MNNNKGLTTPGASTPNMLKTNRSFLLQPTTNQAKHNHRKENDMDLTYDEYIDFINDLCMQEFTDFLYHFRRSESTTESLTIL